MPFPATTSDISVILDRLEKLPKIGQPLRAKPRLRETLFEIGRESAQKLGTPRSEIELLFRARLREHLGRD